MSDEMRLHIELEAAELVRRGVSPEEAQRRARVAFGGLERFTQHGAGEPPAPGPVRQRE